MARKNSSSLAGLALWRFGFRQTYKGALLMGLLVGSMFVIQALGYQAAYPSETARNQFASSMKSAPALGILYGKPENLTSPTGYMVYRVVPVFGLIAAVWGVMVAIRLLRGQEEDGRWEQITAANTTSRRASLQIMTGFGVALLLSFALSTAITFAATQTPEITASLDMCLLLNASVFLPALLFGGVGVLVSQLAVTRRRAILYGLVPLFVFFAMRALANTIEDVSWLHYATPLGWAELISPVVNPQWLWMIPLAGGALACSLFGFYLAGKRDLGAGFIAESDVARSRFFLLGSPAGLTVRQNMIAFVSWGIGAVAMSGIVAAVADVAARSLKDSPQFETVVARMGGSFDDLKIAFLGAGALFTAIVLLLLAATSLASVRRDEAKNYLDNLLVRPVHRTAWLVSRLSIILLAAAIILSISIITTWVIGQAQGIAIDLGSFLLASSTIMAAVVFTLGVGCLLYGILPRVAALGMYVIIAWSFIVDIVGSVVELNDIVSKSSLFHYVSLSPTAAPDWSAFLWLSGLGAVMMLLGCVAFTKRDIISE